MAVHAGQVGMNTHPIECSLPAMLERMYKLSVWTGEGKQYLPVFDYEWRDITNYLPAKEAITHNTLLWFHDHELIPGDLHE